MNRLVIKELRLLRPTFILTLAVVLTAPMLCGVLHSAAYLTSGFLFVCTLMGASVFSSEFSSGTFSFLLIQPMSRQRLWHVKMGVLAAALLVVILLARVSYILLLTKHLGLEEWINPDKVTVGLPLFLLGVFCAMPFLALLVKNALWACAVWYTLPLMGCFWLLLLANAIAHFTAMPLDSFVKPVMRHDQFLFVVYCVIMYWLGYRKFVNYQDIDPRSPEIRLPAHFRKTLGPLKARLLPKYSGPFVSLFRKELELHRPSFIVAAVYCLSLLMGAVIFKLFSPTTINTILIMKIMLTIYMVLVPIITGATCVADERNLGTLNWQMTLPVSRQIQWWLKFIVSAGTCVGLGMVLPIILLAVGQRLLGMPIVMTFSGPEDWNVFGFLFGAYLTAFCLFVFASSISLNPMWAVVSGFGLIIGCGEVLYLVLSLNFIFPAQYGTHTDFNYFCASMMAGSPLILSWLVLTACLAGGNFRRVEITKFRNWFQASVIVLTFGIVILAASYLVASRASSDNPFSDPIDGYTIQPSQIHHAIPGK